MAKNLKILKTKFQSLPKMSTTTKKNLKMRKKERMRSMMSKARKTLKNLRDQRKTRQ